MGRIKRKPEKKKQIPGLVRHSERRTIQIAKAYKGVDFNTDFRNEYMHAYRCDYMTALNKALSIRKEILIRVEKERNLKLARKYSGVRFQTDYKSVFGHARRYDYFNELIKLIKYKPHAKHSKKRTLELAKKYKGKCFCRDHRNEYSHAIAHNYLNALKAAKKKK